MKQSIVIILVIFFIVSVTNSAIAGNNKHYGNGHNRDYSNHRGHNDHRRHNNHRRYNNHHGHYPGAVLGGLLLGGIIGSSLNTSSYQRTIVYTNANQPKLISGNNFLLKSNGDCFLITDGVNGSQILSSVPSSNCR